MKTIGQVKRRKVRKMVGRFMKLNGQKSYDVLSDNNPFWHQLAEFFVETLPGE